jgi:hypothetical protein
MKSQAVRVPAVFVRLNDNVESVGSHRLDTGFVHSLGEYDGSEEFFPADDAL